MKKTLMTLSLTVLLLTFVAAPALATTNDPWNALMDRATDSLEHLATPGCQLTVSGTAAISVEPDNASIVVGVSAEDPSAIVAQEKANTAMASIIDALKALGIDQRKISTNNYSIGQNFDYNQQPAALIGYQVSNTLTVEVQEFALISQVIDQSVKAGANQVQSINFDSSKRAELYRQALQDAIAVARDKATLMATAAGKELGDLRTLSENSQNGSMLYNTYDSRAMGAVAEKTQILGGEIYVSAQVTLVYDLK